MGNYLRDLGVYHGYKELDDTVFIKLSDVFQELKEQNVSSSQILASFVRIIRFRGRNL